MEFSVNRPVLFVVAGVVVAVVLAQSIYFLLQAWRHGKRMGMTSEKMKKIAATAAVYTIAPAVAIVISVITLSKDLGVPLPWLRLSVVGSLSYETVAATNAESAMGLTFGQVDALTAKQYVTIAWVMTLSILVGIWLITILGKKVKNGIVKIGEKDKKWSDILMNSMFIGMISAFLGYVFSDFGTIFRGQTWGLIGPCVMLVSAVVMAVAGLLFKKTGKHWISDYALPVSLVVGMASAIPITAWLG